MNMQVLLSKKRNPAGDYTNFTLSVSGKKSKTDIITITCPADEKNKVIEKVIKIFGGGQYYESNS